MRVSDLGVVSEVNAHGAIFNVNRRPKGERDNGGSNRRERTALRANSSFSFLGC